jgi:hypothetical protein
MNQSFLQRLDSQGKNSEYYIYENGAVGFIHLEDRVVWYHKCMIHLIFL